MRIFESVQTLYNYELYEEVIFVHELENATNGLTQKQEYHYNVYVADAYSHLEQHKLSIRYYEQAIQLYSQVSRGITTKNLSDADVRYRFHKSLMKEHKYEEALGVLLKISSEGAPPKINHAIAKLLVSRETTLNDKSSAIKYMKSLVEHCPVAYCTLDQLARVGVTVNTEPDKSLVNINLFIKAHKLVYESDIHSAIQLLTTDRIGFNRKISIELGRLFYSMGMKNDARSELAKAHAMDDERADGMEILAYLYAIEPDHRKNLENLGPTIMRNCANSIEAYIIFGYLSRSLGGAKHLSSALQFAHKACNTKLFGGRVHSGAMMLKALILKDMDRSLEAISHLKEAIQDDPQNFDLYESIIALHLQENNFEEAKNALSGCSLYHPNDPRVDVLKAKLLMKSGSMDERMEAQRILEKIVSVYPFMLDAVWVLIDHYEATCNYSKGIELLNKLTNTKFPYNSMAMLHHLLGEFHAKIDRPRKAYSHFNLAILKGHKDSITQLEIINNAMTEANNDSRKLEVSPHTCPPAPPGSPRSHVLPIPFNIASDSPDAYRNEEDMEEDPPDD